LQSEEDKGWHPQILWPSIASLNKNGPLGNWKNVIPEKVGQLTPGESSVWDRKEDSPTTTAHQVH